VNVSTPDAPASSVNEFEPSASASAALISETDASVNVVHVEPSVLY